QGNEQANAQGTKSFPHAGNARALSRRVKARCFHDPSHSTPCRNNHTEESCVNEGPNALLLAVIGVGIMVAGYFLYSKYLGKKVFKLNAEFKTPAHAFNDGTDYVPTNRFVLRSEERRVGKECGCRRWT